MGNRGRFLSKEISLDKEVNQLSLKSALIWTWLIAHLDKEGRYYGDPVLIKGQVFPRRKDINERDIQEALKKIEEAGIILNYEKKGERYIFSPHFEEHQIGLRKDRETASKIPAPPEEKIVAYYDKFEDGVLPDKYRSNAGVQTDNIPVKLSKVKGSLILIKGEGEVKFKIIQACEPKPSDERAFSNARTDVLSTMKNKRQKELVYDLQLQGCKDNMYYVNVRDHYITKEIIECATEIIKRVIKITGQPSKIILDGNHAG